MGGGCHDLSGVCQCPPPVVAVTFDGRPGRLAAVTMNGRRRDLFARAPDDTLVHWWEDGPASGVESLGGVLRSDPVAVSRRDGRVDVFARGAGSTLLHWWWDAGAGAMAGPEPPRPGWRCAFDPVAVVLDPARVDVFARAVGDGIRRWSTVENDWAVPEELGVEAAGQPWVIPGGEPEFFVRARSGELAATGTFHAGEGRRTEYLGGSVAARPVAERWGPDRIDVFAVGDGGDINHWGWSGRAQYWDNPEHDGPVHQGRWYSDGPIVTGPFTGALHVTGTQDQIGLIATRTDGTAESWSWDGSLGFSPHNVWRKSGDLGRVASEIAMLTGLAGRGPTFLAWGEDGSLLEWFDGTHGWSTRAWPDTSAVVEPAPVPVPPPDFVVRRPQDLVVLGIDGGSAILGVTLPPQHVGEEVNASGTGLVPATEDAGFPVWRSRLAGSSRLAVKVAAEVDLSVAGVLAAWAAGAVPEDGEDRSVVELTTGLVSEVDGAPVAVHETEPLGQGDVVGLWRTRLVAAPGTELGLRGLASGEDDGFSSALGLSRRRLIVAQGSPAAIGRLELSALGGSVTVAGRWESFEWDHETTLGRDMKVRTLQRGLLYPTGHRAEYVEITERIPGPAEDTPIAVLRTNRYLLVTEPVRSRAADERLARVLPFDELEITTTVQLSLDDPDAGPEDAPGHWHSYDRLPLDPDELTSALDSAQAELDGLPQMPGDWVGSPPIVEDLADQPEVDELSAEQARQAARTLELFERITALRQQIAAVREAGTQPVPSHFVPCRSGQPVTFSVRGRTADGEVAFELPMIFVADARFPETGTMRAFDSLDRADVADDLIARWATLRAGIVDLQGAVLDMVRSPAPMAKDRKVVRRLNLVGVRDGRGYRARLGPPPDGNPGHYAASWAFEAELPEMRSLLPDRPDTHTALVRFADGFAEPGGSDLAVPFLIEGHVDVNFHDDTGRSGGLIAPVIEATGLGRETGLVNVDGLADPLRMVTEEATILGVGLRSLLAGVSTPPAIVSELSATGVPLVSMEWPDVELTPPGDQPLQAIDGRPKPRLTMRVTSGTVAETTCTVSDFALALPWKSPVLRLLFDRVEYLQRAGEPPDLKISGLRAEFLGALDLLQGLQEKVGLGESLPEVRVTGSAIVARYVLPVPDLAVGAFVIRNAAFTAQVRVPFRGGAVAVAIGFASREKPFNLSVLMFGGGGYVDVEFTDGALSRLEIVLEFGAAVAIDFVVARGEAHVLGGIRYELEAGGGVTLAGFLRIGGSLEILGLVSVSVELFVQLGYQTSGNRLVGRATLVLELDLTLWSDSVELDSGEWVISGGEEATPAQLAVEEADLLPVPSISEIEEAEQYRKVFRS